MKTQDKSTCCGCTACASICGSMAIKMQADSMGFLYPLVDEGKCIDCGLCERVCPTAELTIHNSHQTFPLIFALHNKDIEIWKQSSSGGVFYELSKFILENEGLVYGAAYDNDFLVCHQGASTKEEAQKFRGSKYVQSNLEGVFIEVRDYLRNGKKVLFSGTPCQVAGLRSFLIKPYDNLYTVDVLCHGVPSPRVFSDYINFVKRYSPYKLTQIFMKDKTFGWGYQNLRLYYGNHKSQFNTVLSNLWNKLFFSNLILRPSCYECKFTNIHRPGDISIGDYWGIENVSPKFADSKGISLLMINTEKGKELWTIMSSRFDFMETSVEECMQSCLSRPVAKPQNYSLFGEFYSMHSFEDVIEHFFSVKKTEILKNYLIALFRR